MSYINDMIAALRLDAHAYGAQYGLPPIILARDICI
jgi:hypothetical protein